MKVLYHIPSLHTIYAHRTIYNGYKNAFLDMGHEFRPLTSDETSSRVFLEYEPDLFITSSFSWYRKFLDFDTLAKFRKQGMFTLVKVDFWDSPLSRLRINEAPSIKDDKNLVNLIKTDQFGDAYFHVVEQDDQRMDGFEQALGKKFYTIPLAADAIILKPMYDSNFEADISYIGTNLPDKRKFFSQYVLPFNNQYNLKLYGQDWSRFDRCLGWGQRVGQYFNVPMLRSIRKPILQLEDEGKIYNSSTISINVHEEYQRKYGGDCNERTFKIPFCGGFQVVDNVGCIKKYFKPGKEIIVADNPEDWVDKIRYYLENPAQRKPIIKAGMKRISDEHTYHHRAAQMLSIAKRET